MPTSKGSSTPGTSSSPSNELAAIRALHAPEMPIWSEEPLANLLAERLAIPTRAARSLLEGIDVRVELAGPLFGKLDEWWLFRAPADGATLGERLAGIEGVVGWKALEGRYALVRTFAQDAVEREKRLRSLHKALAERPLHQLHRAHPLPPKRKLTRADWALLSAMRKKPFAPLDALAAEAGAPLRLAKERVPKLVAEGIASLEATPRSPLAHLLVRVSPSSTAAARHALDAFHGALVRAHVPDRGEATLVDAETFGATQAMRAAALDVPGVASVEPLAVTSAWRDDAGMDALVKRAFSDAS